MALATGGAKIQSLYWEAVLSTGLAFMLPIYFFTSNTTKHYPEKMDSFSEKTKSAASQA